MNEHDKVEHLTYFKIQNFKKFDSIEVKDIGKINLVVGDNNVGKTSLLESLLFSENSVDLLRSLHQTLCFRGFHIHRNMAKPNEKEENYLKFVFRDITKPLIINYKKNINDEVSKIKLDSIVENGLTKEDRKLISSRYFSLINPFYFARFTKNSSNLEINWIYANAVTHDEEYYFSIIPSHLAYDDDLVGFFNEIESKSLKKKFVDNLAILIPNIEDVLQHSLIKDKYHLCVTLKNDDAVYPLTRFGDGAVKLARILLEITKSGGKRLMIDEIGDGIHYTRLKEFWRTVIKACFLNEVQLFATTHSSECLEVFSEVMKESEFINYQEQARLIEMRQKDDVTKTITFGFNEFSTFIENENEVRGRKIRD